MNDQEKNDATEQAQRPPASPARERQDAGQSPAPPRTSEDQETLDKEDERTGKGTGARAGEYS